FSDNPLTLAAELIETVCIHLVEEEKTNLAQALQEIFPIHLEEKSFDAADDLTKTTTDKIIASFELKLQYQREILAFLKPELHAEEKAQSVLQEVIRNLMIRK